MCDANVLFRLESLQESHRPLFAADGTERICMGILCTASRFTLPRKTEDHDWQPIIMALMVPSCVSLRQLRMPS